MKRTWLVGTLSVCMAICLLAGSGLAEVAKTGYPIVEQKEELEIFVGYHATAGSNWDSKLFVQEAEKLTNVHIKWILVPQESQTEKKNLLLASGDLPEVFMGALNENDLMTYGPQGAFVKLSDYLADYAPNFQQICAENEGLLQALTMPDGNIYSFPKLSTNPYHYTHSMFFFRKAWLDQLGKSAPINTDELYELLLAMKNTDLNGNGIADEIPLANYSINGFGGAYGLCTRGSANRVDVDPVTGALRYTRASDDYKNLLMYLNKLYTEGLLDPECFTASTTTITAKAANKVIGAFNNTNDSLAGTDNLNWVGLPEAMEGPTGYKMWTALSPTIQGFASYTITAACKNVELAVRWGDSWYKDPGATIYWLGVEGVSYFVDENGNKRLSDWYTKNPDGLDLVEAKAKNFVSDYANHPIVRSTEFGYDTSDQTPRTMEAKDAVKPYSIAEVWPALIFTPEERSAVLTIQTDMNTFVNEMEAQFISGKASFDEWDSFLATLEGMGLKTYLEVVDKVIQRNGYR